MINVQPFIQLVQSLSPPGRAASLGGDVPTCAAASGQQLSRRVLHAGLNALTRPRLDRQCRPLRLVWVNNQPGAVRRLPVDARVQACDRRVLGFADQLGKYSDLQWAAQ